MPIARLPAVATLVDARVCPWEKFDELYAKIVAERKIPDGYFLLQGDPEAHFLFLVNGGPYGAGRWDGDQFAFRPVREFFAFFRANPSARLSFCVTDKRLTLGLLVLFIKRPRMQFTTDLVDMEKALEKVQAMGTDALIATRGSDRIGLSLFLQARVACNYFSEDPGAVPREENPADQLLVYVYNKRDAGPLHIAIYDDLKVGPASDASAWAREAGAGPTDVYARLVSGQIPAPPIRPAPPISPAPPIAPVVAPPVAAAVATAPGLPAPPAPPVPPAPPIAPVPTVSPPAPPTGQTPPISAPVAPTISPGPTISPPGPAPAAPVAAVAAGPRGELILTLGDKVIERYPVLGDLTIGRIQGNDILIDNLGVSRRHAVVKVEGDRVLIQDLGSANGTFVNGVRVQSRDLADGDEITIVKHRIVFRTERGAAPEPAEAAADVGQQTMYVAAPPRPAPAKKAEAIARLVLTDLREVPLRAITTFGSGPGVDLPVEGFLVGKLHARIVREKEGSYRLIHLAKMASTRVNEAKVDQHLLQDGDVIEIGKQKFIFRLG